MKKFLCIILSVAMLLSLCGCVGSDDPEDIRGTVSGGSESQPESQPEFSMGESTDGTYTNDFLGIGCTLPEGWAFYTDAQMKELNNIVGDYLDENVKEQLQKATVIYDMCAQNQAEGSSVNVILEKLNVMQLVGLNIKTTLEAQIETIKSTYKNVGYTDVQVVYQKVTVGGKEFDGLKITAKLQDFDFSGVAFAFLKGEYLANVTVCSLNAEAVTELLGRFTIE